MRLKLKLDRGLYRWLCAYDHAVGGLHGTLEDTAIFLLREHLLRYAGKEGGAIGQAMKAWIDENYPAGAGVKKSKQYTKSKAALS